MGRHAALAFAAEGANLALCTSRRLAELEDVAAEARAAGVQVLTQQCDVTDAGAVAGFVQRSAAAFGRIDVAVNLAGYRAEAPFLEEADDVWARNFAVNLSGPRHVCLNVIPLMKARRWGRIITVSGIAPYIGMGTAKAMVKLGIVGFSRGLAREFAEFGITANTIGPGYIGRHEQASDESFKPLTDITPMKRKGTPSEAVSLMVYLGSESAGFITGQSYLVNGGTYFQ
jgi:NAD(P)-dependent dehydrogenase (short-subunit alcohol dehydrogenase family)